MRNINVFSKYISISKHFTKNISCSTILTAVRKELQV